MSINIESLEPDVFDILYTVLNNNATQITDSQNNTVSLQSRSSNQWMGSFPNPKRTYSKTKGSKTEFVDDEDNYPLGVIGDPNSGENLSGFREVEGDITADIRVFATRKEHPSRFIAKAWDAIRSNESEFTDTGCLQPPEKLSTSTDSIVRGENMMLHEKQLVVSFDLFDVR